MPIVVDEALGAISDPPKARTQLQSTDSTVGTCGSSAVSGVNITIGNSHTVSASRTINITKRYTTVVVVASAVRWSGKGCTLKIYKDGVDTGSAVISDTAYGAEVLDTAMFVDENPALGNRTYVATGAYGPSTYSYANIRIRVALIIPI